MYEIALAIGNICKRNNNKITSVNKKLTLEKFVSNIY